MKAKELRVYAAEKCKAQSGILAVTMLLHSVIEAVASSIMGVVLFLIGGPLTLGWVNIVKKTDNGENVKVEDLFSGFNNYGKSTGLYVIISIFTFLWSLLFIVPGIIKSLAYSMSFYILDENPDMGIMDCKVKSQEMMTGHKWELFCLLFSYIGWYILCLLTLGILYFWVGPKVEVAKYKFYLSIKQPVNE